VLVPDYSLSQAIKLNAHLNVIFEFVNINNVNRLFMKLRIFITLMIEAARTSETSVDIQLRTRQYIPEDSELHTRHRENLKSHRLFMLIFFISDCLWSTDWE
jgi:hypothetical protein